MVKYINTIESKCLFKIEYHETSREMIIYRPVYTKFLKALNMKDEIIFFTQLMQLKELCESTKKITENIDNAINLYLEANSAMLL